MSKFTLRQESQALREAKLMKSFNHPYILNFIETFISDDKLFILMDFAEGGSLADFVKKSSRPIPCKTVVMWFTQLLLAVYYLHERKIIHRDIKCQNILIMGSGKIVLADFGVSRVLDNTMALATTMVGTPLSMAPEVYKGKSYSTQSDMWSYGIVIYEVCARTVPFQAKSFAEVRQKVLRDPEPSLPRDYKVVRDIYLSCLQKDPHKRATAKDLLNDSTIQSVIRTMKKKKK